MASRLTRDKPDTVLTVGGDNGALAVGTIPTVAKVGATNLEKRKVVEIVNNGTTSLFWGFNPATSPTTGQEIPPCASKRVSADSSVDVYVVSDQPGGNAVIIEAG